MKILGINDLYKESSSKILIRKILDSKEYQRPLINKKDPLDEELL
jgi:hypothetical protein